MKVEGDLAGIGVMAGSEDPSMLLAFAQGRARFNPARTATLA